MMSRDKRGMTRWSDMLATEPSLNIDEWLYLHFRNPPFKKYLSLPEECLIHARLVSFKDKLCIPKVCLLSGKNLTLKRLGHILQVIF